MSETLRLGIAIVVDLALLLLSTVVPSQLQHTFPLGDWVLLVILHRRIGRRVPKEVEIKASLLVLGLAKQSHAHHFLVELETRLSRFDADHGVVESVVGRVGRGTDILVQAADDFHPVAIGIFHERNVSHTALCQLLLELVARILESLACRLDIVDRDSKVSKSTMGLSVPIDHAVIGIIFSAVVVGELDDGIAVGEVPVTLQRRGTIVGEEVERELVFWEIEVLDLAETEELVEFHCLVRPVRVIFSRKTYMIFLRPSPESSSLLIPVSSDPQGPIACIIFLWRTDDSVCTWKCPSPWLREICLFLAGLAVFIAQFSVDTPGATEKRGRKVPWENALREGKKRLENI